MQTGQPIKWDALAIKCGSTTKALGEWPDAANGICVKYACGECDNSNCEADHGQLHELPRVWMTNLVTTLRTGVDNM